MSGYWGGRPTWSWDDHPSICTNCNEPINRKRAIDDSSLPPGFYGFFDEPSPVEYKMIHRIKHEKYIKDQEWRKAHPWRAFFRQAYDPNQIFMRRS